MIKTNGARPVPVYSFGRGGVAFSSAPRVGRPVQLWRVALVGAGLVDACRRCRQAARLALRGRGVYTVGVTPAGCELYEKPRRLVSPILRFGALDFQPYTKAGFTI